MALPPTGNLGLAHHQPGMEVQFICPVRFAPA